MPSFKKIERSIPNVELPPTDRVAAIAVTPPSAGALDAEVPTCWCTLTKSIGCPTKTLQNPPTAPGAKPRRDARIETSVIYSEANTKRL
mmetsp:Transcript_39282/g.95043  ORF Transcript_39282/g.95043 Transcript_39282/m.95043 type:complete len:89 (+) Transcript_39282:2515-2781(+)